MAVFGIIMVPSASCYNSWLLAATVRRIPMVPPFLLDPDLVGLDQLLHSLTTAGTNNHNYILGSRLLAFIRSFKDVYLIPTSVLLSLLIDATKFLMLLGSGRKGFSLEDGIHFNHVKILTFDRGKYDLQTCQTTSGKTRGHASSSILPNQTAKKE